MPDSDSKEWEVEEWYSEELEPAEEPGVFTEFYQPEGPRRLHICDGDLWHYLDIDGVGEDWFHLDRSGQRIVKSLRWLIRCVEYKKPNSNALPITDEVDFRLLSDDLRELDQTLRNWNGEPNNQGNRMALGTILERLSDRLNRGDLKLVRHTASERELLTRAWQQVLWVLRLFESGHIRFEKLTPYAVEPDGFELESLAASVDLQGRMSRSNCNESAGTDCAGEATETTAQGPKGRGMSAAEANRRMESLFAKDPDAGLKQTQEDWAQLIGCSKGTVHKTEMWKLLHEKRQLMGIKRRSR